MRHDPAAGAIVIMLRSLKIYGMAQAVTDLIDRAVGTPLVRETMARGVPAFEAAIPMLSQLLKAELAEREVRSIAYHMKSARFPAYKDLSGFDFAASEINEATVRTLHRCEFMDGAQNVVLIHCPAVHVYMHERGGPRHWQNPCCHRPRHPSHRASPSQGSLLLDHRTGQRP